MKKPKTKTREHCKLTSNFEAFYSTNYNSFYTAFLWGETSSWKTSDKEVCPSNGFTSHFRYNETASFDITPY